MNSIAFFAIATPLLVFVVVCCLGIMGDRVKQRRFGTRDMFILLTIVAVALGIVAAVLHSAPLN